MVLARMRLRRAALRLAARGWPVTPGACLRANRFDCGRIGCRTTGCHPAVETWQQVATRDRQRINRWWRDSPHSVLLPTGVSFDALDIPAPLAALVIRSGRWTGPLRGPVATIPTGRWLFLVQPGEPLLPELAGRWDVVLHGRGSWMPAPPTRLPEGAVRWSVSPTESGGRLPDSIAVQRLLAETLMTAPRSEQVA
jgi:hypothetical protein